MERANFIGESIEYLHRYTMKSLQKQAEEHGVTIPQVRVIAEVFAHKTVSVKLLSQNLKMTQSTVSDIVERLVTKGFLEKTPNIRDKRLVDISLSERLDENIDESIAQIQNQSLIGVLDRLDAKEQEIVEQGMQVLVSAVKEKMIAEDMDDNKFFNILYFSERDEPKK
ncbi:helix-turn-helix domain-containing protein [Filibacter tadaridae]|uniref:Putative HTH-type transcriptional regulator YusO n=1 Tax=Filibacter tadaridae TaxID=2483811 RepID=A0A3P5WJI7_9BACL|nr:helix-turn-helix domain-containing protein [Filibacter tadaridae]VDC21665.1 putative HTH-type transcriptional regulator YusO [Filibacter tadaridae]